MLKINGTTLTLTIAILASTALGANASAAGLTGTAADFGAIAVADSGTRLIIIDDRTKSINVVNGETVQFNINGKMFTWHFDTFHDETSFDLSKIAPPELVTQGIRVYVAANPLYRG